VLTRGVVFAHDEPGREGRLGCNSRLCVVIIRGKDCEVQAGILLLGSKLTGDPEEVMAVQIQEASLK